MTTITLLILLPILGVIYLCLNKKHKEMVNNLLKKAFSWFLIRRKKNKLEDGDARKAELAQIQKKKETEIKEQVKKDIKEVKSE